MTSSHPASLVTRRPPFVARRSPRARSERRIAASPHATSLTAEHAPAESGAGAGRGADAGTATDSTARSAIGSRQRAGADDFGPLATYLRDQAVTDVFINGPDDLWFDRGDGLRRDDTWSCPGEAELRQLAVRLIALGGRHIDEANPCVDVRLHDGVRLHAVLPPAAPRGTVISLRIPPIGRLSLDDLNRRGFFEAQWMLERVRALVRARSNILISGGGGAGKTTLLSALLSEATPNERIVAIEDVAELRVEHPHFVSLEARQANLEGAGEISLERLLREALRMRPDRLVLGECRGPEIRELLSALNTGHDGGAGTLHANSLHDVAARIEAMGALAALTPEAVARQAVSAINVVLHLERVGGRRRLAQVGHFGLDDRGRLAVLDGVAAPLRESVGAGGHRLVPERGGRVGRFDGDRIGRFAYDLSASGTTVGRHA